MNTTGTTGTSSAHLTEVEIDGKPRFLDLEAGRRAFLRNVGLGAAAATIFGATGIPGKAVAQSLTDADILNFALNLEYLEAQFYLIGAFGRRLAASDTTGRGDAGAVVGGRQVAFTFNSPIRQYAKEIAQDEEAHVKFLRSALGNLAVAQPRLNIGTAFAQAANAAGLGTNFDAYANETNFALAAFIFEDVGVTAYKGAAPLLQNKAVLEAAAGILAVEAYHTANIRTVLFGLGLIDQAQKISNLRDAVDGSNDLDQGLVRNGRSNITPVDANGIAFSRSPRQVLNIVYLGGSTEGGFFPQGVNGSIR